jgi:hypothetical protein
MNQLGYLNQFINKTDGCWLWTGRKIEGYGVLPEKKTTRAHRKVFELVHGPIPSGLLVCHKCDIRSCVNPDHLFLGTHTDNAHDRVKKGRSGITRHNARLSDDQVRAIRLDTRRLKVIAAEYKVGETTVSNVIHRRCYQHVPDQAVVTSIS